MLDNFAFLSCYDSFAVNVASFRLFSYETNVANKSF